MHVSLVLEHPHNSYTNLDFVNGKVLLRVPNPATIASIVVKLEGESRSRLLAPVRPDRPDKQRPVLEVHKILYKTQVVWPPNQSLEDLPPGVKAAFPIEAGQYEYPFSFKIPLNNACQQQNSLATNVSFSGRGVEVARTPTQHVKATLPPSLNGFPGEAEIRYYVKVTVNRPQFFKENPRAVANFTFLPIEPPRPPKTDEETYARRQHQFLEHASGSTAGKKRSSIFSFDRKGSSSSVTTPTSPVSPGFNGPTPRFTVDARLPNPAILTCTRDVPLRILVKNMSERNKQVYLQMLQIELIGYTKVRAHEVQRVESNSWIVASFSNMAIPLGSPSDAIGTEVPINPEYWSDKPLPNTVAPTFNTCNISRYYELEVRVGMGYGSYKHGEDQLVVLPLRLPVKVFSGIEPPAALLEAASLSSPTAAAPATSSQPQAPLAGSAPSSSSKLPTVAPASVNNPAPHPPAFADATASSYPPAQNTTVAPATAAAQPPYDDAPPSYEDAIGQNLPPVDGRRADYAPPPVPEGAPRFSDEKRR